MNELKEIENFRNNLKKIFDSKYITESQLARESGVDVATISRYVNSQNRSPRLSCIVQIAKVLDVSLDELVSDDMTYQPKTYQYCPYCGRRLKNEV